MKKNIFSLILLLSGLNLDAQVTNPAITEWLINSSGITGRHYMSGNSTPISDNIQANVQTVKYSQDFAYINSTGIPSYIVGPYQDGNPAQATDNNWLFKIPLNPVAESGSKTATRMGPIGLFINGIPMYNDKDGASYLSASGQDDIQNGDGVWNRNAILAESDGFDCAKGHPSPIFSGPPGPGGTLEGGSYHHHQNPTAFNLDKVVLSDICDLYLADGMYTLNATEHSPIIGYAFDGFPVYGSYGYANSNGSGGLKLIKSSYQKRNISVRTHYADGTDVTDGPPVGPDYPLGWYAEDFEFVQGSGDLDEHNGRICNTPEYPDGIYAYFATVDENWNTTFPYMIGPEYYGRVEKVNFAGGPDVSIGEEVTLYEVPVVSKGNESNPMELVLFPNPSSELVAIQINGILKNDLKVELFDLQGKLVKQTRIRQGSTIWYLDTRTVYDGEYIVKMSNDSFNMVRKVLIRH